jgi:D-alanyl-lipoteichoic acid acyltransferase DltB (MBOAT superfamily)
MNDWLSNILAYSQNKPLLFTQLFFWAFFILVLVLYLFFYKHSRLRSAYLFAVSLFFYFKTSGVFVVVLILTICSDFLWGRLIHKSKSERGKRFFLSISVVLNLSLLCYFKYSYFFNESYNQITGSNHPYYNHFAAFSNTFFSTSFSLEKFLLPVGVSFFVFQSLSYTIDCYRDKVKPLTNILDYGFFVCFFPHLVAGPIVKAHDFIYQISQPYRLEKKEFGIAVFWIINGFCKKIIADYMAVNYVDRIFENPNFYTGVETIAGIFGYSLQIYMDFSGYTDMAIGLALILGYRLKTNFDSPYKATSTSEFWKRWHISLSSWLQEYLYIPLGGNRKGSIGSYLSLAILLLFLVLLSGKLWLILVGLAIAIAFLMISYFSEGFRKSLNTNINLMVTMLLGGLWHGSSWLFIIWGGLNGLGIVMHKLWLKISPFKHSTNYIIRFFLMFCTLSFISFTRIFFRSDSLQTVQTIFDRLLHHPGWDLTFKVITAYSTVFTVIAIGYLIHWLPSKWKQTYRVWFAELHPIFMGLIGIIAIVTMYQFMSGEMQPFIYFQF